MDVGSRSRAKRTGRDWPIVEGISTNFEEGIGLFSRGTSVMRYKARGVKGSQPGPYQLSYASWTEGVI